jgi:predicted Ser/Thr protein kinase
MGAVYKARQPGLDRLVAVKILPPEVAADPAFAERFTREARALAKLSHQNIVSVFDFGQVEGQFYFIMEYVDGANLRQLIEGRSIRPEEALAIVPQICEALQFAHNEGIVHRDIKPENILIDKQGRVKIADFGLAKLLGKAPEAMTLTAAHQVMGTLHYMAPEQMRGSGMVDHRADIYSLGVVFYEMLTGQLPIGRFEPPSRKVQVDVRLDEVVLRALENEPEKRYQRASELKHDTEQLSSVGVVPQVVMPKPGPLSEVAAAARKLRNPMAALFLVGLAQFLASVALATWLGLTLARIHSTPRTPESTASGDAASGEMTVTVSPHEWWPYVEEITGALCLTAASSIVGLFAMGAAVFGSRLQLEGFVHVVCGLVCAPSLVWPFGLATALVAFSRLGLPNVRAAFAAVAADDETLTVPSIFSQWTLWTGLGVAAALLSLITSLLPWSWVSVFGFADTGIGIDTTYTWHGLVVCIIAGVASLLIAGFAIGPYSRLQGTSALIAGLGIAAIAGAFVFEALKPPQAESSATVSGDAELADIGAGMAEAMESWILDAIQQRPSFGAYAAIVCGALLALVGAVQLLVPRLTRAGESKAGAALGV